MPTAKQVAANRANAKKSTGPKSAAEKDKVSQNRLAHGLRGRFRVLENVESQAEFDDLLDSLIEDEQPVGRAELELVVKMGPTHLARRPRGPHARALFRFYRQNPDEETSGANSLGITASMDRVLRYHAFHDRAYQRASKELLDRRKERLKAEIGSERQKRERAEEFRKAEKHAVAFAIANLNRQRLEMKLGAEIADALPPEFDVTKLNSFLLRSPAVHGQS